MKNILLYILFLFISTSLYAQKDSLSVKYDTATLEVKQFKASRLNDFKTDDAFNYVEVKSDNFFVKLKEWVGKVLLSVFEWFFGVEKATGIVSFLLQVLPYLIAALVLFLLLKFFLKVNTTNFLANSNRKSTVILSEDEEIIRNYDINELITTAISNKNYRLAIRYYYLKTLKTLEEKNVIEWQLQKTNEDYINEISNSKFSDAFKNVTHLYDFIWYGNFKINELEFQKAAAKFSELNSKIE